MIQSPDFTNSTSWKLLPFHCGWVEHRKQETCKFLRSHSGRAEVTLRANIVVQCWRVKCPMWYSTLKSGTITLSREGGHQSAGDGAQYHWGKMISKYDACYRTPVNFILLPETEMFLHFKLFLFHFCYFLVVKETLISISKLSAI